LHSGIRGLNPKWVKSAGTQSLIEGITLGRLSSVSHTPPTGLHQNPQVHMIPHNLTPTNNLNNNIPSLISRHVVSQVTDIRKSPFTSTKLDIFL
jgi:hypothetical protein